MFGTRERPQEERDHRSWRRAGLSAAHNNDKVGCIFFSDRIEKYVPPKKCRQHVLRIISDLVDFETRGKRNGHQRRAAFFTNVMKKRCNRLPVERLYWTLAMPSPVKSPAKNRKSKSAFEEGLKIAASRHDVVGLRILRPPRDRTAGRGNRRDAGRRDRPPCVGRHRLAPHPRQLRPPLAGDGCRRLECAGQVQNRLGVDGHDQDYVAALIRLFKMR